MIDDNDDDDDKEYYYNANIDNNIHVGLEFCVCIFNNIIQFSVKYIL